MACKWQTCLLLLFVLQCLLTFRVDALYDASSSVKVYNSSEYNKLKKSGVPFIVEFFSSGCGHCRTFAPEYEKAAKALKDVIKVIAVDDQNVMQSESIQGFPTVKFVSDGATKTEYHDNRTAKSVIDFAFRELRKITDGRLSGGGGTGGGNKKSSAGKGNVVVLTDHDFEQKVAKDNEGVWFVKFYATWCSHCTALAPTWEELATKLKGKVKVAKVDANANQMLARHFNIKGFPTLIMFPSGGDRSWSNLPSLAQLYTRGREIEDLMNYALSYAGESLKAAQLISQDMLDEDCGSKVCIIAFLPHILDSKAEGRNKLLDVLNKVTPAVHAMPVKFFWSEGGDQFDLEEKLHLGFGFPAVVAINQEKKKFAIHKGTFTEESLRTFITGLMAGKVAVDVLPQELPKLKKITPWDGKDAKVDDEL